MFSFPLCYFLSVFALVIHVKENIVLFIVIRNFIVLKITILEVLDALT